jgi:hypothetical protein
VFIVYERLNVSLPQEISTKVAAAQDGAAASAALIVNPENRSRLFTIRVPRFTIAPGCLTHNSIARAQARARSTAQKTFTVVRGG